MPEGPSIVILRDEVKKFTGKKIIAVSGNSKIDKSRLLNNKIVAFKSWGKHFLICFKDFTIRIHFLMFGSYKVNEKKPDRLIRLNLTFKKGEINFYACDAISLSLRNIRVIKTGGVLFVRIARFFIPDKFNIQYFSFTFTKSFQKIYEKEFSHTGKKTP